MRKGKTRPPSAPPAIMCDVDADFEALLNDSGMAEVDAMVPAPDNDASTADTVVKMDDAPQQAKQASGPCNKPALAGKKRQLLVPQAPNKRKSLQVSTSPSAASGGSALCPSKPPAAGPEPSAAASSPAEAKPSASPDAAGEAKATEPETTGGKEADAGNSLEQEENAEMPDAADEEPEVQSPLKKAPASDADADAVADADADNKPSDDPEPSLAAALEAAADEPTSDADKPSIDADKPSSTAAASGGAPSSKALAAGKRKGLTVAKAAAGAGSTESEASKAPKTKPAAPKAKPAPKATTSSAPAGSSAEAAGQKMPKAQPAFFFFCKDARPVLKDKEPGLTMQEYGKKLGEMWRELSEAEKKPYNDMAVADKEKVAAEIAAMDPAVKKAIIEAAAAARTAKKQNKTDKAAKAEEAKEAAKAAAKEAKKSEKAAAKAEEAAKKRAVKAAKAEAEQKEKAGFKVYLLSQFKTFKEDNPEVETTELSAMMQKAWEALEQAAKEGYMKQAEEEAEVAAAAKALKANKKPKPAGKRSKKAAAGSDAEDSDQECTAGGSSRRRAAAEDEDSDSDREDVDWEANAAAGIFSRCDDSFLVARRGLMLTEYGKVDARKAKARLLHGGAGSSSEAALPVDPQEVEDFDAFTQKFWAALKSRIRKGSVDLDELEEGSVLEMCYVLGKLQEKGMELDPSARRPKGDLDILRRLPVMRLSMIVQRLLDLERQNSRRLQKVASGLLQAIRDKGEEGLKANDAAVVAAAAQLESN